MSTSIYIRYFEEPTKEWKKHRTAVKKNRKLKRYKPLSPELEELFPEGTEAEIFPGPEIEVSEELYEEFGGDPEYSESGHTIDLSKLPPNVRYINIKYG